MASAGEPASASAAASQASTGGYPGAQAVVLGNLAIAHARQGSPRLGKGAGYSDIEVALLQEAGRIGPSTVIVATVHPLQVINEPLPETKHDFSVDLIITPDEVGACEPRRRPSGLYWNN